MDEIIEYDSTTTNIKNKKPKTNLAIFVSAVALGLCVLSCIYVLIISLASKEYVKAKHNIVMDITGQVFVDDTAVVKLDNYVLDYQVNFDGSYGAFLVGADLYVVESSSLSSTRIANNAVDYRMSANGNVLAYVDDTNTLFVYNMKKKTKKTAEEDVLPESIIVSPNGKHVAFVKQNADVDTYLYSGKKSKKVAEDRYPIAVSNDGKYVYCVNYNNMSLYVYPSKGEYVKLTKFTELTTIFNYDCSEIIYSDGEDVYFSKDASNGVKLFGGTTAEIVFPKGTKTIVHEDATNAIRPVKSFKKQFVLVELENSNAVGLVNEDYEGKLLSSDISGMPKISKDKRYICYVNVSGGMSKYIVSKNQSISITDDAIGFEMSESGKKIYFVTKDNILKYKSGNKAIQVAEGVTSMTAVADKFLYYVIDGNVVHRVKLGKTTSDDFNENGMAVMSFNIFLGIYDKTYKLSVIK